MERDKFLTEAMGDYVEPKWKVTCCPSWGESVAFRGTHQECLEYEERHHRLKYFGGLETTIRQSRPRKLHDFSTWAGFGKLWEWAQQQEWWRRFVLKITPDAPYQTVFDIPTEFIHPDRFANAVYEYLKQK